MGPERARRQPPPFRRAEVTRVRALSPRMVQVTLEGTELCGLIVDEPAASVRLLLPQPDADGLVMPAWAGNEFRLPDGTRPTIRTLTPRRTDPDAGELDVAVVVHGPGAASHWAETVGVGGPVAVSGPARGYPVPTDARAFLLAGDETALPAIGQLLEELPDHTDVEVHVELAGPQARIELAGHTGVSITWHELPPDVPPGGALFDAVSGATIGPETYVWAAGEAAAVQRIRRLLFQQRDIPRSRATVRGYWKHGRSAQAVDEG